MRIEEREMPVYEQLQIQPSPVETALYHVCKLLEKNNMSDDIIKQFITHYEKMYGSK